MSHGVKTWYIPLWRPAVAHNSKARDWFAKAKAVNGQIAADNQELAELVGGLADICIWGGAATIESRRAWCCRSIQPKCCCHEDAVQLSEITSRTIQCRRLIDMNLPQESGSSELFLPRCAPDFFVRLGHEAGVRSIAFACGQLL